MNQVINKEEIEYRFLQVNSDNHSVTLNLPSKWIRDLSLSQHQLMKLQLVRDQEDIRVIVSPVKENE